jgi:hypothetical protein
MAIIPLFLWQYDYTKIDELAKTKISPSRLGVTGGDSPCGVEKITPQGKGKGDKLLGGIS